ncbi:XRE family transcriptional regulator [uncultured Campylobacter sp.]|uniref:XRE family transcriptional regulator n=1 Tax=uncultured Campylobacter sp. TaxID=218934 RepID=UPI00262744A6|nr:XRE family transcriptional regulator [uncultured Campylobacter sp.]
MDLGKKIRIAREERGLNQAELASKLNITSRTLQNYEYGTSIPDIKIVQEMAKIFEIQVSYFLDENFDVSTDVSSVVSADKDDVSSVVSAKSVSQNKKVSPNNQNSVSQSEKMKKLDEIASGNKNKIINLRFFDNVSAAAGYGANNDDESFEIIEVTAKFLSKILRVIPQEYDVISVLGDSMEPLVKNGDMVLVKPTSEASNGEIVIANLGGDLYVKKLLRDPIKRNVRLTSMNNFYEDIVIEEDELEQLNIVGVVKKVMSSNIIAT